MVSTKVPLKRALTAALILGSFFSLSSQANDKVSVFVPSAASFHFRSALSKGPADRVVNFGPQSVSRIPILGDWNGDGIDTLGLYDPTAGSFALRNSNQEGPADRVFKFGPNHGSTLPVVGDWNGDGIDTVAVYDFSAGEFQLADLNIQSSGATTFRFGLVGVKWYPVSGDWNGDGVDTVGLYDQGTSVFKLRDSNTSGAAQRIIRHGNPGRDRLPVAGDWNGDGSDSIGIYKQDRQAFRLRRTLKAGSEKLALRLKGKNLRNAWPAGGQWLRATQPEDVDIRLNAGGKDFLDSRGAIWVGDGYLENGKRFVTASKVASPHFQSYRQPAAESASLRYKFSVPKGRYRVSLYFSEFDAAKATIESRVFDVSIEGKRVIKNLDVLASVGANTPLVKKRTVQVSDRSLLIRLDGVSGVPRIAAIRVQGLESSSEGGDPGSGSPGGPDPGSDGGSGGENPGTGNSGSGNPGGADSGSGGSTGGGAGSGGAGSGNSGGGDPGSGNSGTGNSGGGDPGTGNSGSGGSGGGGSGGGSSPVWAGNISGGAQVAAATINLSTQGTADWAHYGRNSITDVNRRARAPALIGPMIGLGSGPRRFSGANRTKFNWSDGAQVGSASGVAHALYFPGKGSGFRITLPAGKTAATVKLYVGGWKTTGRLEASLSDNSAAPFAVTLQDLDQAFDRVVALTYRAATDGQTLTVTYRQESNSGNVTLSAVALQGSFPGAKATPQPIAYKMILKWAPNPEPVLGYRIYFGPNKSTTVLQLRDLRISLGDLSKNAPSATFKVKEDLGLSEGEEGCFRVVAYNVVGDSQFSDPVCGKI